MIHTIKLIPTLPALRLTSAGELKMPLPICRPTTRLSPLQYVTVLSFSSLALPAGSSAEAVRGKSMSLYENDVIERRESEERGDRIEEFSSSGDVPRFEAFDGDDASDAKSTSSSSAIGLNLSWGQLMVDHPSVSTLPFVPTAKSHPCDHL